MKENNIIKNVLLIIKNQNFVSALFNITLVWIFAKFCIGYNDFLKFFTNAEGIWFNIILTYILINNIQTPYFQPPKDMFLNSLSLLLLIIPTITFLENKKLYIFDNKYCYYFLIVFLLLLIIYTFYTTIKFFNEKVKNKSPLYNFFEQIIIKYNLLFLFAILIAASAYRELKDVYLIIICYLIVSYGFINKLIKSLSEKIFTDQKEKIKNYGNLYRIDEPNIYRILLTEDINTNYLFILQQESCTIKLNPLYIKNGKGGKICTCLKFSEETLKSKKNSDNDIVCGIEEKSKEIVEKFKNLVGFVVENSTIEYIKFEFTSNTNLKIGDVIYFELENELENKEKIYYQIINGFTNEENFNNNPIGVQIITASQLGIINEKNQEIEKYSWFPKMNSLIYKSEFKKDDFEINPLNFYIGHCSGLNMPIKIDVDKLIGYHSAILGMTGTGKTTLAFRIIEEVAKNHKVICVDITGEYRKKFDKKKIEYSVIGNDSFEDNVATVANRQINVECGTYGAGQQKKELYECINSIQLNINKEVDKIISGTENGIFLLEIKNIVNTTSTLQMTELYLSSIFNIKKEYPGGKILLVLEEAHTIIPEINYFGENKSDTKAILGKISQIALQGRKYGVGLLIISQRTALVSKTILSQCNTFFTFSLIDQTSLDFLGNFYGKTQIDIIPNLEQFHLIANGLAIGSQRPIILNIKEEGTD